MTHTRRIALGSACLLALIVPACSSDDATDTTLAPAAPAVTDAAGSGDTTAAPAAGLTISGNNFSAASVTAGTDFTITNNDSVAHTVTDDAGGFGVDVPAGGTATLKIDAAGTYAIHCEIHSSMHGSIAVA